MKYLYYLLVLLFPMLLVSCNQKQEKKEFSTDSSSSFNMMSYNIRLDVAIDGINAWPHRKEKVAQLIQFHQADVFGLQEVIRHQALYLDSVLVDFDWCGKARDNGKTKGEYSPIFYNKNKFELLATNTFWLSETPDQPSKGWDATCCNRVCTWAKLKDKISGTIFYFFNTHFDHQGIKARQESAKLIRSKIEEITNDRPVILTGDFNCSPDSEPYKTITSQLNDAFYTTQQKHYGPLYSFSSFFVDHNKAGDRIDYIFTNKNFEVLRHGILTDSYNGRYPSDHLPVLAEIKITK